MADQPITRKIGIRSYCNLIRARPGQWYAVSPPTFSR